MDRLALSLFGAVWTVLSCYGAGNLLFGRSTTRISNAERWPLEFLGGAALVSSSVLALGLFGWLNRWMLAIVCLPFVLRAAGIALRGFSGCQQWFRGRGGIEVLAASVLAVFFIIYSTVALAPEHSPDGTAYHLVILERYEREGRLGPTTNDVTLMLPQGAEMLFLLAGRLGAMSSAALVHLFFLAVLTSLIAGFAWRHYGRATGWLSACLVACSPVVGVCASAAYVDVALAATTFAVLVCIDGILRQRSMGLMSLICLLAGYGYSIKYTGAVAFLGPVVVVALRPAWLRRGRIWIPLIFLVSTPLVWTARNLHFYSNPVAPFFNRTFESSHIVTSVEEELRRNLKNFGGRIPVSELPAELCVRGAKLQGLLGPCFLLLPISLISMGKKWPAPLLLGGALCLSAPMAANRGARFIVPALASLALLIAVPLGQRRLLAGTLLLTHALLSLPPAVSRYCSPSAWRIREIPVAAALGLEPEEAFLKRQLGDQYSFAKAINGLPKSVKILSLSELPAAYIRRNLHQSYRGAESKKGIDRLLVAARGEAQPRLKIRLTFEPRTTDAIGLRARPKRQGIMAGIHEVVLLTDEGQIPHDRIAWVTASPNPSDAGLAFDGNLSTRWRSWIEDAIESRLVVKLKQAMRISGVECLASDDQALVEYLIEMGANEAVQRLEQEINLAPNALPASLRLSATDSLRAMGFTHIAVHKRDLELYDFRRQSWSWQVQEVGTTGDWSLFALYPEAVGRR